MKIKQINLPASQRFACTPRQVKAAFRATTLEWVSFGSPIRTFSFDHRASAVPKLSGAVVASASVNRDGQAHLCVFPIKRDGYPDSAASDFATSVLPGLASWISEMHSRPETAIVGVEESVIEWTGSGHSVHRLTFL